MKPIAVALIQTVIAVFVLAALSVLQIISAVKIKKAKAFATNKQLQNAYRATLIGAIISTLVFMVAIAAVFSIGAKWNELEKHVSKLVYTATVISGITVLATGALAASAAVNLQCFKTDSELQLPWQYSTITAAIGILGATLMLAIQYFTRREQLTKVLGLSPMAPTQSYIGDDGKCRKFQFLGGDTYWYNPATKQASCTRPTSC